MSETKKQDMHWLQRDFGINIVSLDPEVQRLVKELGEKGVRRLVEDNKNTEAYRDERITLGDRNSLISQIQRLKDEGGGKWASGQVKIGDKPQDWTDDEMDYLTEDR